MISLPNCTGANVFERVTEGMILTKLLELNLVGRKLIDLQTKNSRFPKSAQNLIEVSTVFFALRFDVEWPYVLLFSPRVFHYQKRYMNVSPQKKKKNL